MCFYIVFLVVILRIRMNGRGKTSTDVTNLILKARGLLQWTYFLHGYTSEVEIEYVYPLIHRAVGIA